MSGKYLRTVNSNFLLISQVFTRITIPSFLGYTSAEWVEHGGKNYINVLEKPQDILCLQNGDMSKLTKKKVKEK
jgi:hypothetical protein